MSAIKTFYGSYVGKKIVMATSGIVLFGFVLIHMLGNLKLYQGEDKLNAYAEWLRVVGAPLLPHEGALWIFRIVLLAAVGLHVLSAYQVTRISQKARPVSYKGREAIQATYASRTIRWGGVILLLFIVYHLAHLTVGSVHPDFEHGEVYRNVVTGLSVWWVSAFYIAANLALGLHLYHGLWSMLQTLGVTASGASDWRRRSAAVFAWVVTLGNISFPIAVLTGVVS
jgi:succinate dehydrogenase / fumarate reductase cytochrome b subunit